MEHDNKINKNTQLGLTPKTVQTTGVYIQDNRPATIAQKKANNTGLPDNLKSGIESLSGHTMDDVKVHYNSDKPAQLNAHAYAQGSEIHIASGQEKHLPHEAWHVVQQKEGRVKPTMQMKGKVNVNDDAGLEQEADIMGGRAMQIERSSVIQKQNHSPLQITTTQFKNTLDVPIQGMFTFKNWVNFDTEKSIPGHQMSVDEVIENIIGTREAQKIDIEKLRNYLTLIDGTTFDSREQLINRLRSDTNTSFSIKKRINFVRENYEEGLDIVNQFFSGIDGWEFKYKLALVRESGHKSITVNTIKLLTDIFPLMGTKISIPGVMDLLNRSFTTTWALLPEDYLEGANKTVLNGFYTTILGTNAELSTLINAAKIILEPGEQVFNGAKFSESKSMGKKLEEDVDVSFIDSNGVLNLIETAYSIHALKNKLIGPKFKIGDEPKGQKQRYQHLAASTEVTQEPVGPLTGSMANDRSISAIHLYYSVPERAYDLDINSTDGLEAISNLIKMNAGLMVGSKRYSSQDLEVMKTNITGILGIYRDRYKILCMEVMSRRADRGGAFYNAYEDDTEVEDVLNKSEYFDFKRIRKALDIKEEI